MNPRWLVRMAQWARHPPSERRVLIGLAAFAAVLAIAGIQWLGWWPDALTVPVRGARP
jgi:type II secretory pathway component PulM